MLCDQDLETEHRSGHSIGIVQEEVERYGDDVDVGEGGDSAGVTNVEELLEELNIAREEDDDKTGADQKIVDCDEEEQSMLLFEVIFEQEDSAGVNAVITLEDLKYWAPFLLLGFLQARLEAAGEEELIDIFQK